MPRGVTNSLYPPHLALMKSEVLFYLQPCPDSYRDWFVLDQANCEAHHEHQNQ